MYRGLRVAVVDPCDSDQVILRSALAQAGHHVVLEVHSGQELLNSIGVVRADLVVMEVRLCGIDGIETAEALCAKLPLPIIFISNQSEDKVVAHAAKSYGSAFLQKPIREDELRSTVVLAYTRFSEFRTLQDEATHLKQAMEDRKLIERAKGIVMQTQRLAEADAFAFLQRLARYQRQTLADIAKAVIAGAKALNTGGNLSKQ